MFLSKVKFVAIIVLAAGFAGSGVGWLRHPANATTAAPAPAQAKAPAGQDPDVSRQREQLSTSVDYPGLDDARATLSDALDHLSKRYGITFHANAQAFRAIDPKIDAFRFTIAETPIPPMRTRLKTVLRTILSRLPAKMGAMYVIRKDHIEITTETAVRSEMGIAANRPLLPLVWESLGNTPIDTALRRLARQAEYNIVIDPRIAEKLQTQATLDFNNVPVDTAVRLLANIAGLSMVRLDNVLYVTAADNAKKLREEQAEINADKPVKSTEPAKKPASDKPAKGQKAEPRP